VLLCGILAKAPYFSGGLTFAQHAHPAQRKKTICENKIKEYNSAD